MKKFIKRNIIYIGIFILIATVIYQYIEIKKLNDTANNPPLPYLYNFYDAGDGGVIGNYVSARGTWESNLKLAYPYDMSQVDCWKQWENCIVADAYTTGNKSIGGINMINANMYYYEIESWDDYKIIAKNSAMCAETVLTVDRTSKKITTITTPINSETEGCNEKLIGEVEVQTNVLADGSKKWMNNFADRK
jgi:hypothetical protein